MYLYDILWLNLISWFYWHNMPVKETNNLHLQMIVGKGGGHKATRKAYQQHQTTPTGTTSSSGSLANTKLSSKGRFDDMQQCILSACESQSHTLIRDSQNKTWLIVQQSAPSAVQEALVKLMLQGTFNLAAGRSPSTVKSQALPSTSSSLWNSSSASLPKPQHGFWGTHVHTWKLLGLVLGQRRVATLREEMTEDSNDQHTQFSTYTDIITHTLSRNKKAMTSMKSVVTFLLLVISGRTAHEPSEMVTVTLR